MVVISLHDPDLVSKFTDTVIQQSEQGRLPELVIESEVISNPGNIGQRLIIGRRIQVPPEFLTSRSQIEMLGYTYRSLIYRDYELAMKGKLVLQP